MAGSKTKIRGDIHLFMNSLDMPHDREKRISEIQVRLKQLENDRESLLQELESIQADSSAKTEYGTPASNFPPTSSEERISFFSRLFRCRADVFPKLWENAAKGIKGYSPACKNEWVKTLCSKPKIKCSFCSNRVFIPLDESIIRDHLEGRITIGTYAIREDDTCIFLAADFDEGQSQQDVLAYKQAGQELGIPIAVERSRSGKAEIATGGSQDSGKWGPKSRTRDYSLPYRAGDPDICWNRPNSPSLSMKAR